VLPDNQFPGGLVAPEAALNQCFEGIRRNRRQIGRHQVLGGT